jgi:methionine sulfoxide reductase catalytic subunit
MTSEPPMHTYKKLDPPSSEITPEPHYLDRRAFIAAAGALGAGAIAGVGFPSSAGAQQTPTQELQEPQATGKPYGLQPDDKPTPWEDITTYNNFYEFGTGKGDPVDEAKNFKTKPWTVRIHGLVNKPADFQLEDLLKPSAVEDRIYRHRCVEGWSMVIPWRGIPLADVIKRAEPSSKAKFIEFTTLLDPKQMPGERTGVLPWPYTEGLRLDEAQHPLALLAVGGSTASRASSRSCG